MKTFQRTNWSNEQILKFLDGECKVCRGDGSVDEYCQKHNDVIDEVKSFFSDFMIPPEEFGAMGYCVEEDMVYHIGGLPEPLRVPIEEKAKCPISHSPENEKTFREFMLHKDKTEEHFYCKVCGEDWP
jgi:hypothetical protein